MNTKIIKALSVASVVMLCVVAFGGILTTDNSDGASTNYNDTHHTIYMQYGQGYSWTPTFNLPDVKVDVWVDNGDDWELYTVEIDSVDEIGESGIYVLGNTIYLMTSPDSDATYDEVPIKITGTTENPHQVASQYVKAVAFNPILTYDEVVIADGVEYTTELGLANLPSELTATYTTTTEGFSISTVDGVSTLTGVWDVDAPSPMVYVDIVTPYGAHFYNDYTIDLQTEQNASEVVGIENDIVYIEYDSESYETGIQIIGYDNANFDYTVESADGVAFSVTNDGYIQFIGDHPVGDYNYTIVATSLANPNNTASVDGTIKVFGYTESSITVYVVDGGEVIYTVDGIGAGLQGDFVSSDFPLDSGVQFFYDDTTGEFSVNLMAQDFSNDNPLGESYDIVVNLYNEDHTFNTTLTTTVVVKPVLCFTNVPTSGGLFIKGM